jgi:hypothetical protein
LPNQYFWLNLHRPKKTQLSPDFYWLLGVERVKRGKNGGFWGAVGVTGVYFLVEIL